MLKIIMSALNMVFFLSIVSTASAYTIFTDDGKSFTGACDNGQSFVGDKMGDNGYTVTGPNGGYFKNSKSSAIIKACSNPAKLYLLKRNALVSYSREYMRERLSSSSTYKMTKINLKYGDDKKAFLSDSTSKVKLLKHYSNETYDIHYDNGKKKWTETTKLIDSYYSVKAGGKIYFVRANDIQ